MKEKESVEVHVKGRGVNEGYKETRFVSRDVAETMVREDRATYPGDPKMPARHENGK